MKNKSIILLPMFLLVLASALISCGQDRWAEYKPLTAMDEWMDSVMRADYYWKSTIPPSKTLNYFLDPESFLSKVKYSSDNASHIDSIYSESDSYGITASFEQSSSNDTIYNAVVTYVATNSPAYSAGLKRGDWIMKVGGKDITTSNKSTILKSGSATTLSLGTLSSSTVDGTTTYPVTDNGSILNMSASSTVSDKPVHYYTTISAGSKKVGYLVYSSFNAGVSEAYNNELRAAFASFKANGVTDFVLDLRYNSSGDDIESARLLASMLVPSSKLGSTFLTLVHADTSKNEVLKLDNDLIGTGANLNLSSIYILTTSATARLSEVLIASLAPYMSIYTIGSTTKGLVGVTTCYTNAAFNYKFYPVTSIPVNAANETYSSAGITASKSASDTTLETLLDFGNSNETMLSTALSLISAE